jgi:hypothetical protein
MHECNADIYFLSFVTSKPGCYKLALEEKVGGGFLHLVTKLTPSTIWSFYFLKPIRLTWGFHNNAHG